MRFRASSGFLLKSLIAVISTALVVLLAVDSWRAWHAVQRADRLATIAEVSALGFRAMHNMRVIRSYTVRALKDATKRDAAMVEKTAIVGITGLKRILADAIATFSGTQTRHFDTRREALEWLGEP